MQTYNDKTSKCKKLFKSIVGHAKWTHCINCSELPLSFTDFWFRVCLIMGQNPCDTYIPECEWDWDESLNLDKIPSTWWHHRIWRILCVGFPCSSEDKESASKARDLGLIPRSGRFPEKGNGNPLQYPWLENSMGRGAWWATVHGVTKSQTWLSD